MVMSFLRVLKLVVVRFLNMGELSFERFSM